jgi:hypothetical protein
MLFDKINRLWEMGGGRAIPFKIQKTEVGTVFIASAEPHLPRWKDKSGRRDRIHRVRRGNAEPLEAWSTGP